MQCKPPYFNKFFSKSSMTAKTKDQIKADVLKRAPHPFEDAKSEITENIQRAIHDSIALEDELQDKEREVASRTAAMKAKIDELIRKYGLSISFGEGMTIDEKMALVQQELETHIRQKEAELAEGNKADVHALGGMMMGLSHLIEGFRLGSYEDASEMVGGLKESIDRLRGTCRSGINEAQTKLRGCQEQQARLDQAMHQLRTQMEQLVQEQQHERDRADIDVAVIQVELTSVQAELDRLDASQLEGEIAQVLEDLHSLTRLNVNYAERYPKLRAQFPDKNDQQINRLISESMLSVYEFITSLAHDDNGYVVNDFFRFMSQFNMLGEISSLLNNAGSINNFLKGRFPNPGQRERFSNIFSYGHSSGNRTGFIGLKDLPGTYPTLFESGGHLSKFLTAAQLKDSATKLSNHHIYQPPGYGLPRMATAFQLDLKTRSEGLIGGLNARRINPQDLNLFFQIMVFCYSFLQGEDKTQFITNVENIRVNQKKTSSFTGKI